MLAINNVTFNVTCCKIQTTDSGLLILSNMARQPLKLGGGLWVALLLLFDRDGLSGNNVLSGSLN